MTWQAFYLICFVVGFALSVVAFFGSAFHWPLGHHAHATHWGAHAGAGHAASDAGRASPYNLTTLMAFLAWFGGIGYLLTGRELGHLLVLALSVVAGLAGSAIIFGFLTKVLLKHERQLETADFEMTGVLGRVTIPIRAEGTGEIVYSQEGTRRSAGARSDVGRAIPRGSEVVVTRYEKGIAYVRPWEELTEETAPRVEKREEETR